MQLLPVFNHSQLCLSGPLRRHREGVVQQAWWPPYYRTCSSAEAWGRLCGQRTIRTAFYIWSCWRTAIILVQPAGPDPPRHMSRCGCTGMRPFQHQILVDASIISQQRVAIDASRRQPTMLPSR